MAYSMVYVIETASAVRIIARVTVVPSVPAWMQVRWSVGSCRVTTIANSN